MNASTLSAKSLPIPRSVLIKNHARARFVEDFLEAATITQHKPKTIIGSPTRCEFVGLILSGSALLQHRFDEEPVFAGFLNTGDFFIEQSVKNARSGEIAVRSGNEVVEVAILSGSALQTFVQHNPQYIKHLYNIQGERYQKLTSHYYVHTKEASVDQVGRIFAEMADTSYASTDNNGDLRISITRMEIAGFVNCTRETITKVYKELEDAGYIETDGGKRSVKLNPSLIERYTISK